MSSRSVSTKARVVLVQVKEAPGASLRIDTVCNFKMKSVVKLNRLFMKFLLLRHVDVQESSRKGNAKFPKGQRS